MTTIGGSLAVIVPSSGIVIWKSASSSRRYASNGSVRPVELVDEEDRGAGRVRIEGVEEGPLDEETAREDVVLDRLDRGRAPILPAELGEPDPDHLPRVVPLVDGGGDVEPLVALEPDEPPPEDPGEDPRDLRLPDPRLAFEEQRTAHPEGEEHRGGEAPLRDVVALGEPGCRLVDGGGKGHWLLPGSKVMSGRFGGKWGRSGISGWVESAAREFEHPKSHSDPIFRCTRSRGPRGSRNRGRRACRGRTARPRSAEPSIPMRARLGPVSRPPRPRASPSPRRDGRGTRHSRGYPRSGRPTARRCPGSRRR